MDSKRKSEWKEAIIVGLSVLLILLALTFAGNAGFKLGLMQNRVLGPQN